MIQDLITASRRMASLYRFRFIQPAHLLYALTGNETGRELVSRQGYDLCLLRAALIREFKSYASKVRVADYGVEPSELFDKCCQCYLTAEDEGSYEGGLHGLVKAIEVYRAEDRIVSIALEESDMKRSIDGARPREAEMFPDFDDVFHEEMEDRAPAAPVQPMRGYRRESDPDRPAREDTMCSVFQDNPKLNKAEEARPKPAEKVTKDVEEARAAVRAAQRDLSALAREGKLDPVVGREAEIDHVIEILMRRRKPNVILVAEPGVGKSALVEGLASRLATGACPDPELAERPVREVSLTSMVAGSRFRGDFESRMSILIAEAEKDRSILFIDEIHMIVGSGAVTRGGMDGANILKPALARDGLSLIGATTPEEAMALREDRALMRRFEIVYLSEPQRKQMEIILQGAADSFLSRHGVRLTPSMRSRILDFGERYLGFRRNPDRTFDLLDLSAVSARIRGARKIDEQDMRHAVRRLGGDLPRDRAGRSSIRNESLLEALMKRVKGQDGPLADLVAAIEARDGMVGFSGVFILTGPAGTGKNHTVECLAEHLGKRLVSIRHDESRPDGLDMTWARLAMALEADAESVIAIQNAGARTAAEIESRIAVESGLAAAPRSPSVFCLSEESGAEFGFRTSPKNVRHSGSVSGSLIVFDHASGAQLEALVEAVVKDIRQLQKDAGLRCIPDKRIRSALEDVISSGAATYAKLRKAGMAAV